MQWSRAKKQFELLLAPSLQKRLRVHVTEYSRSSQEASGQVMGRGWITLDGTEVVSIPIPSAVDSVFHFPSDTMSFGRAVRVYLSLAFDEAAMSDDVLVRGLAFLDRRMGKRRLRRIEALELDAFSQKMFRLRCEVEGLEVPEDALGETSEGASTAGRIP